jgi:DHA1 family tetracycline resistance protein-like MFS transporter
MGRILLCYLILCIAMNVYAVIWSYFGQERFGWDARMVGISLAVYGIAFAIGQATLVGPLIRWFGERRAAQYGMVVDIVTLALLGLVTSGTAALVITPFTALGGVVTPAMQAIASRSSPADAQGEVQGVLSSLNAVGLILSPLLMTGTFSYFSGPSAPFYSPGAPFLLASAMMAVCLAILAARPRAPA